MCYNKSFIFTVVMMAVLLSCAVQTNAGAQGRQFLIITSKNFEPAIQSLVQFHNAEGYNVSVKYTENEFRSVPTTELLRDSLVNWLQGGPTRPYLLLAGDYSIIPSPKHRLSLIGEAYYDYELVLDTTIIYRTTKEGLRVVDSTVPPVRMLASVGRMPARTEVELSFMVAKTIEYARQHLSAEPTFALASVQDNFCDEDIFVSSQQKRKQSIPSFLKKTEFVHTIKQSQKEVLINLMQSGITGIEFSAVAIGDSIGFRSDKCSEGQSPLLTRSDIESIRSSTPFFVAMISNSRSRQSDDSTSLAEAFIRNPYAAVGVYAPGGATFASLAGIHLTRVYHLLDSARCSFGDALAIATEQVYGSIKNDFRLSYLGDPSSQFPRNVTTNTAQTSIPSNVQVYPAPATDIAYVQLEAGKKYNSLLLYDILGKVVQTYQQLNADTSNKLAVTRGSLPAGIYFLTINEEKNSSIVKIIFR